MHWIAPSEKDTEEAGEHWTPRELRQRFATIFETLRRTRDLLLPHLLSGQVELKTN